ncbi:MAG: hypothetical protein HY457_00870 [Parcubacteria group bacterium]|nr:hypothetical protein [Parcubacteria group bacterium]
MHDEEQSGGVSGMLMRDLAFAIAFVFIIFFIFLVPFISPSKEEEATVQMPGNVMVWIRWQDGVDVDVDLWTRAPGDEAIGYSNRAGNTFNLLRDDLGSIRDTTELNYEVVFGRDMPNGMYTVNVHLYRNGSELLEVPVDADVFIIKGSTTVPIAKRRVVLTYAQEITVVNFTLENGELVGEPDDIFIPLRSRVE